MKGLVSVVAVAVLLVAPAFAELDQVVIQFTANLEGGEQVVWQGTQSDGMGQWDEYGNYLWMLGSQVDMYDSLDNLVASILVCDDQACYFTGVTYHQDPQVTLDFAVVAGPAVTSFNIASALLSFPTINNPDGQASAAYTVQDNTGDGATLDGLAGTAPGNAYLAQYNGWAAMQAGTTFTEVIPSLAAPAFQNNSVSADVPGGGGTLPIGTPVDDMSSLISFTLTPFDSASGTTTYTITPEPSSLLLLALAACALRRRS